jgi:hypothetical protein
MNIEYSKNDKYIAYLEIVYLIGLIGFWIGWFLDIFKSFNPNDALYDTYLAFEYAFPIADAWLGILLFLSAYAILKNYSAGIILSGAAGSVSTFLGLVDISFNLRQGVYQFDILALFINLFSLIVGIFLLIWFTRFFNELNK